MQIWPPLISKGCCSLIVYVGFSRALAPKFHKVEKVTELEVLIVSVMGGRDSPKNLARVKVI